MTAPNTTTTTMVEEIGKDQSDGILIGKTSSALVGFFGTSPVAQQSTATAVATTAATSTSPVWGFSGSTQANAIVTAVNACLTALKNLGLIA